MSSCRPYYYLSGAFSFFFFLAAHSSTRFPLTSPLVVINQTNHQVSEATFRDIFLPPFAAGVEAGALTLMSAFVAVVGGVPATGSRWLQTDVLRGELGFEGFVVR